MQAKTEIRLKNIPTTFGSTSERKGVRKEKASGTRQEPNDFCSRLPLLFPCLLPWHLLVRPGGSGDLPRLVGSSIVDFVRKGGCDMNGWSTKYRIRAAWRQAPDAPDAAMCHTHQNR